MIGIVVLLAFLLAGTRTGVGEALRAPAHPDVDPADQLTQRKWLRDVIVRAKIEGLPRVTLKGLRHTHATLLLELGEHPKVVQERLGHSTITTTMNIYSHVTPTMQRDAAEQVGNALFGD